MSKHAATAAVVEQPPQPTAVVEQPKAGLPVEAYDYSEYAGQGFESLTKDDYAVPFISLLQALSPQIDTITDARPGMLINMATSELFSGNEGIVFVPAESVQEFVEWKVKRGGFVARHAPDSELVRQCRETQPKFSKWKVDPANPNSNDIIDTSYVYGILVKPDGTTQQSIIAFSSTKKKAYKNWMSMARAIQVKLPDGRRVPAPLFAHRYRITTVKEKNKEGQEYFNFMIRYDGKDAEACRLPVSDYVFKEASEFYKLIREGAVKIDRDSEVASGSTGQEDADIPFA